MPSLLDAYNARALDHLYARAGHPAEPEHRRAAVARARRPLAPAVHAALVAQNRRYAPSSARDHHLAQLAEGAAAVVTGQQVGLFLGPLYTLYKAATAVVVARALAAESGQPVVPVFWLQTEDHDLPEIASTAVRSARGAPTTLTLPADASDRRAIAHRALPPELERCRAELGEALGGLPHAAEHLARLDRHYRVGAPWGVAFAGLLAELFAEEGLVLVDPRDAALARVIAPVHRRAIVEAEPIATALSARSLALEALGYTPAVHVRPGAPLCFVHPGGPEGPRHRVEPALGQGGRFVLVGGTAESSTAELLARLEAEPLAFSSSALLRPIVQDTLLPTAAYVGGPGELAYFAQLEPLYAAYALPMPLVVPRARFVIVDDKVRRVLERLGLSATEVSAPEDVLLARAAARAAAHAGAPAAVSLEARLLEPLGRELAALRGELAGLGLESALEKTEAAVRGAVAKLVEKHDKARVHQDAERVEDVRRVRAQLYPGEAPQERVLGLSYHAARVGERALVAAVLAAIEPWQWSLRELSL